MVVVHLVLPKIYQSSSGKPITGLWGSPYPQKSSRFTLVLPLRAEIQNSAKTLLFELTPPTGLSFHNL